MKRVTRWAAGQSDVAIVLAVMGILLVLFVPIPRGLLDFLVLTNFSFALLVLLLTFVTKRPVEFSTFPSLLLLVTLFRLSLNIAATRLILADGDAGRVIAAVGSFVVGGQVVVGLVVFTMAPVLHEVNRDAFEPFMNGAMQLEPAYTKGTAPLRDFMAKQTREEDLSLMVELSRAKPPASIEEVSLVQLVPAFMLSELRAAFQIGVLVFLPFVLIDLVVSAVLMALGMVMLPPSSFALPLKILVFVLVDGWALLVKALVGSFH
jgi:flagellar biosynthesis protein FliP